MISGMKIKGVLFLALFFFSICLLTPKTSKAIDLKETLTSENSIVVKIQERVEYFFAFKIESKIEVLEKHAEKRLRMAQNYVDKGDSERAEVALQSYLQKKEKQNDLLEREGTEEVLGVVEGRTIEQQKTMEEIKKRIDPGTIDVVEQVQERVVNQVTKHVVEANGAEGATNFMNEVVHVWAPGTGPGGGEAGVVYEGGGEWTYAPGTGPGGSGGVVIEGGEMKFATGASMDSPGADVKNVEVKTGGGEGSNLAPGTTGGGLAPGTTQDGGNTNTVTNTVDPGGVDSDGSSDGETWLAP